MKGKFLKTIPAFLAVAMLVGCGSGSASSSGGSKSSDITATGPGWKADTKPITFDAYFNASWMTEKWTTDIPTRSTSYITKKTGVTLNLMAPTGNEAEKMTTMIASQDVPDIVFSDKSDNNTTLMYNAGLFLSLTDLADKYDKDFYNIVKPSQIAWFKKADGKVYDYPNFANSSENVKTAKDKSTITGDSVIGVRKDIYEAIGKPDMTTPDGFLKGLKLAREKYPTVNGKPLSLLEFPTDGGNFSLVKYLPNLLGIPGEKDGVLVDAMKDPEWQIWMKTFRKANELGYISKDNFIDKRSQMSEKKVAGQYFILTEGKSDLAGDNRKLFTTGTNKDTSTYYVPLDTIRNTKKEDPKLTSKISLDGWMNAHITTKCKDPARAIRFLNYMMGKEGQHDAYYGEKSVTYDVVDGVDTFKPFILDNSIKQDDLKAKYYVKGANWTLYNSDIAATYPLAKQPYDPNIDFINYAEKYIVDEPQLLSLDLAPSSPEGIIAQNIKDAYELFIPKLIMSKSDADFDKVLSDFFIQEDKLGKATFDAAKNKLLKGNIVKLGIK